MSTDQIISKGKSQLRVDQHFIDQFKLRFGIDVNLDDSFARSKQLNNQNAAKYGKTMAQRVYRTSRDNEYHKFYVNLFYDQVFLVDFATKTLVTTYKLSTAKSWYEM